MDWLTESPAYGTTLASQLLGVKILEICAGALLLLTLLIVIVGWGRHFSWRARLLALAPLAAGIAAGVSAHALHDTYVSWVSYLGNLPPSFPALVQDRFASEIASANQTATVLGWVFIMVTAVLFVLGFVHLWHSAVSERPGSLSAQSS